jgi:hypothetical protein
MQLTAAALLLLPWTATLGAVVYLPIILNIFVITVAVGFGGTQVVSGLMLLANIAQHAIRARLVRNAMVMMGDLSVCPGI